MENFDNIQEHFPFITGLECNNTTYLGIVQNSDEKFITFYDYGSLRTESEKRAFLDLGEEWWNESNRLLPISIFLPGRLLDFRYALKTVSVKETQILFGPVVSLHNLIKKRIKRKQIQLIRKM